MHFNELKERFLKTIFPEDIICLICGTELKAQNRFRLCNECLDSLPYITDDIGVCLRCGKPIYDEAHYCLECQNVKRYFLRVNSPFIYKGIAAKLTDDLKFYNKRYIGGLFGEFVATEYLRRGYDADILLPVPMFKKNKSDRGFNQSELIAGRAAELLGIEMRTDVLVKTRETKHQMSLGGFERHKNLIDAFAVILPDKVKGKTVLLIDDVITTGATIDECAKGLLKAKAVAVLGLTACSTEYKLQTEKGFKNQYGIIKE